MKIFINDIERNFPSSLSEISFDQYMDFWNLYGRDLAAKRTNVLKIEDKDERWIELTAWYIEKMQKTFGYFTGSAPDSIPDSLLDRVSSIYHSCLKKLQREVDEAKDLPVTHLIYIESFLLDAKDPENVLKRIFEANYPDLETEI